MSEVCKIYKPEILTCPICGEKLYYRYAVSNKLVYFSSGKHMRIKNLGYSCPKCDNNYVYVSQTANKLAFKGYTYSAKIVCIIDKMKENRVSRESICDYFYTKNIEISERNIDNLYHKIKQYKSQDYKNNINDAYKSMMEKYNQIRLSIDIITVSGSIYMIVYDYFTTNILAIRVFESICDEKVKLFLEEFIRKDLNITYIASIRRDSSFIPILKNLCPQHTKIIHFNKY